MAMRKLPMRRKSLSFRPHNWTYPMLVLQVHSEGMSLEQLPVVLLALIFDRLQTDDLLQVCLASKYFYLPAAMRLYRRIVVTADRLALVYAKQHLLNWNCNYGTAVWSGKLALLVQVLQENDKLADLVRSVTVTECDDAELVSQLLLCTHAHEFYYTQNIQFPSRFLANALKLTTLLQGPLIAPSLTELCVAYPTTGAERDAFKSLASCIVENRTYQNLRTLRFENAAERNLEAINRLNHLRFTESKSDAPWALFFDELAKSGVKLTLQSLALDGFLKDNGRNIAELLNQTIELRDLEALSLRCTELSHSHVAHFDLKSTLLENVVKYTSTLKLLAVYPTDDCLTCQLNAVIQVLKEHVPNQLFNLLLALESPTAIVAQSVKRAVLYNQNKLRNLRISDRATLNDESSELYQRLNEDQISEWEHGTYYEYRIKKSIFPDRLSWDFYQDDFVTDPLVSCIHTCKQEIANFLKQDVIYLNATALLPALHYYRVVDFTLNVKEGGFLVNGQTVHFE